MSFSIQPATTAAKQHQSFYESSALIFQKIKTIRYYPQGANNENFFSDDQILNIHPISCLSLYTIETDFTESQASLGSTTQKISYLSVEYFSNATCIFNQQFITGGAITCASILLFEKGYKKGSPKFYQNLLLSKELKIDNLDLLLNFLKQKGINCEIFNILDQKQTFSLLNSVVKSNGPIILYLKRENKYIILDSIEDSKITLRDPYHGWKLDISKDTFLYQLPSKYLIIRSVPI